VNSRRCFVAGASALVAGGLAWAQPASATGGLDPDLGTPPPLPGASPGAGPSIRVLLATNIDLTRPPAAEPGAMFSYDGKLYRGTFSILSGAGDRPELVAILPVDAYVYGVLPREIGRGWPSRALEAQAILARTYALEHRLADRPYDVVAGAGDQAWGSVRAESPDTNAAVDATESQVVSYLGGLASVFYSSCCGGHTADAARVWGGAELPYLRGVPDPYCLAVSPDASWTARFTVGALVSGLGPKAQGLGRLLSINLGPPPPDLRPGVQLQGELGAAAFSSAQVRTAVGANVLPGSLFRSLTLDGDPAQAATLLRIEGSGRGHGVGLCQWGARVLAQQGQSARDIVGFYFPGTLVTND